MNSGDKGNNAFNRDLEQEQPPTRIQIADYTYDSGVSISTRSARSNPTSTPMC